MAQSLKRWTAHKKWTATNHILHLFHLQLINGSWASMWSKGDFKLLFSLFCNSLMGFAWQCIMMRLKHCENIINEIYQLYLPNEINNVIVYLRCWALANNKGLAWTKRDSTHSLNRPSVRSFVPWFAGSFTSNRRKSLLLHFVHTW